MKKWWEDNPERFEFELSELRKGGVLFEIDNEARDRKGVIILHLKHRLNGEDLALRAVFPDTYPFFPFDLYLRNTELDHHYNPLQEQICLLEDPGNEWETTDTLFSFIINRLPKALFAGRCSNPEETEQIEANQAEPFSNYYTYTNGSIALVDSAWDIPQNVTSGILKLGVICNPDGLMIVVKSILDNSGKVIAKASDTWSKIKMSDAEGRWIRTQETIKENNVTDFIQHLIQLDDSLSTPKWQKFKAIKKTRFDFIGVIIPEETSRRKEGEGWVFMSRITKKEKKGSTIKHNNSAIFIKAGRAGIDDLSVRAPELKAIRDKSIGIIGLGCIGAPSAIEFSRTLAKELRILDGDTIDAGTAIRWPLGLLSAGRLKVTALLEFISVCYPQVNVIPIPHYLGRPHENNRAMSDITALDKLIKNVDLIYESSTLLTVGHLISTITWDKGIPLVTVSTTPGAWGGRIARFIPGKTGCWRCLQHSLNKDGPQEFHITPPEFNENGRVQPLGCMSPTFTGAGFDTTSIALAGVRLSIATLLRGHSGGYPDFNWDVAIVNLRNAEGAGIAPEWKTYELKVHPLCENH